MKVVQIACIVEGDGEVTAVPFLLRRIIHAIDSSVKARVPRGFRHPSGSVKRRDGIERAVNTLARIRPDHSIFVLIDSDDDCPKDVALELGARAQHARPDLDIAVVLAHREYEAWFLSAAESLAGKRGFPLDLRAPPGPENIRDAKGWLSRHLSGSSTYSPTQDQSALSDLFDLDLAQLRSRSFRKLWKEIRARVEAVPGTNEI